MKDSQRRAIEKHLREQYTSFTIRLHKERDAELIEIYKSIPNKREWIKKALEEYKQSMK